MAATPTHKQFAPTVRDVRAASVAHDDLIYALHWGDASEPSYVVLSCGYAEVWASGRVTARNETLFWLGISEESSE